AAKPARVQKHYPERKHSDDRLFRRNLAIGQRRGRLVVHCDQRGKPAQRDQYCRTSPVLPPPTTTLISPASAGGTSDQSNCDPSACSRNPEPQDSRFARWRLR